MNKIDYIEILSRSVVEQLLGAGPWFREFLDRFLFPGGPVRRFPDGAVEIDKAKVGDESTAAMTSCNASSGGMIAVSTVFRSLEPFAPKRLFYIHYPEDYQEKLRTENRFHVDQGTIRPPAPGEFDLDRLEVTVAFRTRAGKAVRKAFVDAVAAWGRAVAVRGAFDDGPVALVPPGIEFGGSRARFHLDARLSGQDTLNWLTLAFLDFGERVHRVTDVYFGSSAEFIDAMIGPVRGKTEVVEFPDDSSPARSPEPVVSSPVTHVPPDARPDAEFRSRTFPVLALPFNEWDTFSTTVYFGRSLNGEEREPLLALIRAWLLLGSYGGLGGRGTHNADEPAIDEATDSAIIRADMGDTDPEIALPLLIRTLEGFESHGPPIDALVFGRPRDWWAKPTLQRIIP
jgi:hypothetical protein